MVPFLKPQEMDQVWEALESGACVASFTQRERQWVEFWKSMGRRDGKELTRTARSLLSQGDDKASGLTSYLVGAGMAGHLMQGDREGALDLWKAHGSRLSTAESSSMLFRILVASSAPAVAPIAAR
jgi:hypothetical protein